MKKINKNSKIINNTPSNNNNNVSRLKVYVRVRPMNE